MSDYKLRGCEDPRTGKESLWITKNGQSICPEDLVDDCNEMQAEIERLRAQLADSISRETVIATELERDEAREAARRLAVYARDETLDYQYLIRRWPWLNTHEQSPSGRRIP